VAPIAFSGDWWNQRQWLAAQRPTVGGHSSMCAWLWGCCQRLTRWLPVCISTLRSLPIDECNTEDTNALADAAHFSHVATAVCTCACDVCVTRSPARPHTLHRCRWVDDVHV